MRQMSMMTVHRNGSVSRDSVPVWKGPASEVPSGEPVTNFHSGRFPAFQCRRGHRSSARPA